MLHLLLLTIPDNVLGRRYRRSLGFTFDIISLKTMHRAHNIATVLRYGEIGGKTPRCIPKFSRKLIDKWDGRFHGIPSLLAKTDQHCFDPKLTKEHLTEISHLISSNSYDVMQLFVTLGGGHLLVRLLYCPFALSIDSGWILFQRINFYTVQSLPEKRSASCNACV